MEDFKVRLIYEYKELEKRLEKLNTALATQDFKERVGEKQYSLMLQQDRAMTYYVNILVERLKDLGIEV